MSRILAILTVLVLLIGVVACGDEEDEAADTGADVEGTTEVVAETEDTEEAVETEEAEDAEATEAEDEGAAAEGEGDPQAGEQLAQSAGCLACHSVDGSTLVGPTWQGLFGEEVPLESGETVVADEEYIVNSIRNPEEQIHEGFAAVMPAFGEEQLSDEQVQDIVAYIKTLQ